VVSLPRDSDIAPNVGCLLPCGALRVYSALRDARSSFDAAVRVRGFANLLVMSGDSVDGLEVWAVLLVKNVLCDGNVKVQSIKVKINLFTRDVMFRLILSGIFCQCPRQKMLNFPPEVGGDLVDAEDVLCDVANTLSELWVGKIFAVF